MNNRLNGATVNHNNMASSCQRIALYSHETMGLGHLRRNLLIADTLSRSALQPTILLITGAREASAFALPRGVDYVTLPSVRKSMDGQYYARGLDISFDELVNLRSGIIQAALNAFQPDVLIVDKVPRGTGYELDAALASVRARGHTRCVLGLRDILDDPAAVQREWQRDDNYQAIRDYYDAIWVYGDPYVYDPALEYAFPFEIAQKIVYAGYLDRRVDSLIPVTDSGNMLSELQLPPGKVILCMVGGGQDGALVAEAFARAALPPGTAGVLVTGPYMPQEVQQRLHHVVAGRPDLRLLNFVSDPSPLLRRADRVIAMGGYNTVCEVLSYEKHALIVPRVKPRQEQLIRAQRLRDLGLLDLLHPDEVTPQAFTAWMSQADRPPVGVRTRMDFGGLTRIPLLLENFLASTPALLDGHGAGRAGRI